MYVCQSIHVLWYAMYMFDLSTVPTRLLNARSQISMQWICGRTPQYLHEAIKNCQCWYIIYMHFSTTIGCLRNHTYTQLLDLHGGPAEWQAWKHACNYQSKCADQYFCSVNIVHAGALFQASHFSCHIFTARSSSCKHSSKVNFAIHACSLGIHDI